MADDEPFTRVTVNGGPGPDPTPFSVGDGLSALPPGPHPDDDFPGVPHPATGKPGPAGTTEWTPGSDPTPLTHDGQDARIHAAARAKAKPAPADGPAAE